MNIRRLKSLLWLVAFLALLLAGWTLWDLYQAKTQELRYEAKKDDHFYDVLHRDVDLEKRFNAGPTSYAEVDYQQIWLARIDGSVEPVIKVPVNGPEAGVEPPKRELEKLDAVVQVGMVLWHKDPVARLIAVEYVSDGPGPSSGGAEGSGIKRRRLHLTEGEPLRAPFDVDPYFGKVLRIGRQDVVFQWGEDEITLTPGLDSSGDGLPIDEINFDAVVDLSDEFDEWPEETSRREDGSWYFGTNDQDLFASGGDALLQQLNTRSITPVGGGRSSLELTEVEPGSLPARLGFATGDRVISVNGHPMGSKAEAINWGKNNPDEPQYLVLWERLGVQKTTTIYNKNKKK